MTYEIATLAGKGCRFCGSKTVAWEQSKDGKWYLVEAFEIDGETRASKTDFHSKYCATAKRKNGEPRLDHDEEQRKLTQRDEDEENERQELRKKSEAKAEQKSAARFLELLSMDDDVKQATVTALELEMGSFYRDPPTMDYMTEFNRAIQRQKQAQTEWKFLKALLGDPQEEDWALPRG